MIIEASPAPEETNQLLDQLAARVPKRWLAGFERVFLRFGEVLNEAHSPISHVYFPCSGLISLFAAVEKGKEAEMAMIGREGMVGLSVFLGSTAALFRAVAQAPGQALRMRAEDFRARAGRCKPLAELLLRYADALLAQVSLAGACNSLHPVSQRLCRWLLMAHDRIPSDRLPFNQQFLARMLAVRLATVSEAASALKRAGLIHYKGDVSILNRQGLEEVCCGCYRLIRDRFAPQALADGAGLEPLTGSPASREVRPGSTSPGSGSPFLPGTESAGSGPGPRQSPE